MRVCFATCSAMPEGGPDDQAAATLLGAEVRVWNDGDVDWHAYDRVVLRSVWDYTWHLGQFLSWCGAVGPARLRNPPDLVGFNADKRYLSVIDAPSVPTVYVEPGAELPSLQGEVVVKPNVSAGARDTGRFSSLSAATELIDAIHSSDRVVLVQPYMETVEERGETSVVFIGGEVSHVLSKRAVLRQEGVAPVAEGELHVAAAMLEDDLVGPGSASAAQRSLARTAHEEIRSRFGTPLYARIDLVDGRAATRLRAGAHRALSLPAHLPGLVGAAGRRGAGVVMARRCCRYGLWSGGGQCPWPPGPLDPTE